MPLNRLTVRFAIDSVASVQNAPQATFDVFPEESTTMYLVDPSISGPGYVTGEFGDRRTILVAGYEEFDLANTSTPLVNRAHEQVVFDRVMVLHVHNYSATANLAINLGPNACDLPTKKVLRPGERLDYDATLTGAGTPITAGTASKFRVASDANDATYSIYIAGATTRALGASAMSSVATMTAVGMVTSSGGSVMAVISTMLAIPTVAGSGTSSMTCVASFLAAAGTVVYPP